RHLGIGWKAVELFQVDLRKMLTKPGVGEAPLGHPHVQGHLAALEPGANLGPRPGFLPFLTPPGRLACTRGVAPAHPHGPPAAAPVRTQFMNSRHCSCSSLYPDQARHGAPQAKISSTALPRRRATSSALFRFCRPSRVASTTLVALLEPSDFVRMSRIPASSRTARTAAPAITPVPAPAGFSSTRAAPNSPITVWGMVPPTMGTSTKDFLALWMGLRMASGISGALPWASPARPLRSPTSTRAVKLNRRPPLTTLATRLTVTTRSSNSLSSISRRLANPRLTSFGSELQAGFPGAFGQSL